MQKWAAAVFGVGAIVGTLIAGATRHPAPDRYGLIILADFFAFGLIFVLMNAVPVTWFIASAIFMSAVVDGYVTVLIVTWTQQRIPREKLGRVMSVIMMASQGLFPISAAIAGALAEWNLALMLLGTGTVMLAVTLLGLCSQTIRRLGHP